MKIAMIGPVYPFRGGISHYTSQFAEKLAAHQNSIEVFSFQRQYPKWLYPGVSDQDPSLVPIRVNAAYCLDPFFPWSWVNTAQKIKKFQPDLVLFQWWTTFWVPAYVGLGLILRFWHYPIAYIIHNTLPHELKPWDPFMAKLALKCADVFLAQTDQQAERLRSLIPAAPVRVVPLPIFDMFNHGHLSAAQARQKLRLPAGKKTILFFGIIRPYKGLTLMLQALALIRQQVPDVHLLIAGEFWEPIHDYEGMIRALNLEDCVTLDNRYIPNEEVPLYFSSADLLAAPYTGGSQSAVVKLALGFGLPVVVSDLMADDLIRKRSDVLVVASGDVEQLAAGVLALFARLPLPANPPGADDSWLDLVQAVEAMLPTGKGG